MIRPFEFLRLSSERAEYLIRHQSKVVAMTCTHAAINFETLWEQGFNYDSLIMEESGQMLDVESFIPMAIQSTAKKFYHHDLQRIVLIGDHNQLPPIIQSYYLSRVCRMEQSLLERLIRVGTNYIQLDAQGRCRPEIAQLFAWRYNALGNLPHVTNAPEFQKANAGFVHTMQFIDVGDFKVFSIRISSFVFIGYLNANFKRTYPYIWHNLIQLEMS